MHTSKSWEGTSNGSVVDCFPPGSTHLWNARGKWTFTLGLPSLSSRYAGYLMSIPSQKTERFSPQQVDRNLEAEAAAKVCGSTASVAILHSLDIPSTPFFYAQKIALTVVHVGCAYSVFSCNPRTQNGYLKAIPAFFSVRRMVVLPMQ